MQQAAQAEAETSGIRNRIYELQQTNNMLLKQAQDADTEAGRAVVLERDIFNKAEQMLEIMRDFNNRANSV